MGLTVEQARAGLEAIIGQGGSGATVASRAVEAFDKGLLPLDKFVATAENLGVLPEQFKGNQALALRANLARFTRQAPVSRESFHGDAMTGLRTVGNNDLATAETWRGAVVLGFQSAIEEGAPV